MIRLSAFLLVAAMASGCTNTEIPAPLRSQTQADSQTMAACRQRANQVFDQQNRGAIFSQGSQANMPFSANYTPDMPSRGLSAQFGFDRMVNDCVRNTGTETSRTQTGVASGIGSSGPSPANKTAPPPPPAQP